MSPPEPEPEPAAVVPPKNITLEYVAGSGTTADPERLDVYLDPSTLDNGVSINNITIQLTADTINNVADWIKIDTNNSINTLTTNNNLILNTSNTEIESNFSYTQTGGRPPVTTRYYNRSLTDNSDPPSNRVKLENNRVYGDDVDDINNSDTRFKLFHVDFTNITIRWNNI